MRTRIASLVEGWTNSALRAPYVYGNLACGHTTSIALRPPRLECSDCGELREGPGHRAPTCPSCGCGAARIVFSPNAHREEDRLEAVGDEVDCERCDRFAVALAALEALDRRALSHARYRNSCGVGVFYVYRRATESPSGVLLEMSIEARPEAEDLLRRMRLSPLSPTEPR